MNGNSQIFIIDRLFNWCSWTISLMLPQDFNRRELPIRSNFDFSKFSVKRCLLNQSVTFAKSTLNLDSTSLRVDDE